MVEVQLEQQLTELRIVLMSAPLSKYTFASAPLSKYTSEKAAYMVIDCHLFSKLPFLTFWILHCVSPSATLCSFPQLKGSDFCKEEACSSNSVHFLLEAAHNLKRSSLLWTERKTLQLFILVFGEKNFTTFHYCEQREQLYNFGEKILTGGLRSVSCNVLAPLVVQYLALFWKHIIIIIFADYHCFVLPKDFQSSLSLSSSRPVSKFLWSFFYRVHWKGP